MAGRVRAVFRDVGSVVGEGVRAAQRFAERDVRCVWDTFVELDTSTRACLGPPNRVKKICVWRPLTKQIIIEETRMTNGDHERVCSDVRYHLRISGGKCGVVRRSERRVSETCVPE